MISVRIPPSPLRFFIFIRDPPGLGDRERDEGYNRMIARKLNVSDEVLKKFLKEKRLALADNINTDEDKWMYDDQQEDYEGETKRDFGAASAPGWA